MLSPRSLNRTITFLAILAATLATSPGLAADPTVVVMLFDGLAPVYIEEFDTPNFDRMQREGAWTHQMDPAFPTISLINGVTISTGSRGLWWLSHRPALRPMRRRCVRLETPGSTCSPNSTWQRWSSTDRSWSSSRGQTVRRPRLP